MKNAIRICRKDYSQSVGLLIGQVDFNGDLVAAVKSPLTMESRASHQILEETLEISFDEVQSLMDDLWYAGFRPKTTRDGNEVVGAMKEHINDLRRVAFKE